MYLHILPMTQTDVSLKAFDVSRLVTDSVYKAILPRCVCWLFPFCGWNGYC